MMRGFVMLLLCATSLARAGESAEQLALAGVAEFTAAYAAWDADRFGAAADWFRRASAREPKSAEHFYWIGVAEFHRMLRLQTPPAGEPDEAGAEEAMEAAVEALKRAIDLDARHAESHALLGTLYGLKIDGNVFRALALGPRVQKHRSAALRYGPENPRVQYLLGVCLFHTARKPAAWREALNSLLLAERSFEAEAARPAGPLEPRWGYSSCLTFIGRTYEALGERRAAAEYYGKALARHPSDRLATEGLARVRATQ